MAVELLNSFHARSHLQRFWLNWSRIQLGQKNFLKNRPSESNEQLKWKIRAIKPKLQLMSQENSHLYCMKQMGPVHTHTYTHTHTHTHSLSPSLSLSPVTCSPWNLTKKPQSLCLVLTEVECKADRFPSLFRAQEQSSWHYHSQVFLFWYTCKSAMSNSSYS